GKGHVDFLEVWADVFDTFEIQRDRVYVTGHSMGGWGSYLLTLLYPDRFAAAAPYAGPVTQGAWTGLDFEGCDEFEFDGNTPCYIEANGSIPRDQHTRKILENSLHVPYAIMHGTSDELVPYSGVARQAERLFELRHRFRFYTYPGYEHYSHPIMDQWSEAARYMHSFTRPLNPAHVTYKRDMPFETATETVQSDGLPLNFDFDSAYWMSELTPTDPVRGVAFFDGASLALDNPAHLAAPDTGAPTSPGTTGPYVITGLQWLADPTATPAEPENGFEATLEGVSKVRVDLARMGIDATKTSFGRITTDGPLTLRVDGDWTAAPSVTVNGETATAQLEGGVLSVPLSSDSLIVITPDDGPPVETPPVVAFTEGSARAGQHSDNVTIEALLVDGAGAALANAPVTFELTGADGSRSWTATTDDAGLASSILTLAETPGAYTLEASYADETGATADTIDFEILKEDTNLTIATQGKGSKTTWVATLSDADSAAGIAGRTIEFYADGTQIGTATTTADGTATFTPPPRNRNATSQARFTGDDHYTASTSR
ncbi:MAG TPA: prolyl oligopeptidase family serine peptidase, partial [Actinomycetota bacterium]|nr:prolyl oligopeptidase family serine peptidase [Actinomycetota bacterium]